MDVFLCGHVETRSQPLVSFMKNHSTFQVSLSHWYLGLADLASLALWGNFQSLRLHPQKYKVYMGAGDQTQVCHSLALILLLKESEALSVSYGC